MASDSPASNAVADEVRAAFRHELTQMAHGSTHYEGCWKDHWACVLNKLVDEIDRLTHERRAPETAESIDAARYRWLRLHSYVERLEVKDGIGIIHTGPGFQQTHPEFLDADIDEAMQYPAQPQTTQTTRDSPLSIPIPPGSDGVLPDYMECPFPPPTTPAKRCSEWSPVFSNFDVPRCIWCHGTDEEHDHSLKTTRAVPTCRHGMSYAKPCVPCHQAGEHPEDRAKKTRESQS